VIIDTNALSALAEGDPKVREAIRDASGPYLPVITLGEYRFGIMSARDHQRRLRWLADLTSSWKILEISAETARHYAEIRQSLKQQATPIPSNDTWIAALAREHRLPILTNDTHFNSVPGIDRISF
jgi:tRNA(fMet)-specific endonuclease VapC